MSINLPLNRKQKILKLLADKKVLTTNELIKKLGKSRSTIIRDLTRLQEEGYIYKGYGAILPRKKTNISIPAYSIEESLTSQLEEKEIIAKKAIDFINVNDTICFSNGVTTKLIAENVLNANIPVQIITNSLLITNQYASNRRRNITVIGGDYSPEISGFFGEISKSIMKKLRCDTYFLSVHGIDLVGGLTVRSSQLAELNNEIIKRSKKVILVLDYSKFGRTSLYRIDFELENINTVITDNKVDKSYVDSLKEIGVEVIIAP